jgi:hypothetical protein
MGVGNHDREGEVKGMESKTKQHIVNRKGGI